MPNMANITVKKFDGTTDIVYVAQSPASGDATPARWRVDSIGTVPGNRPVLSVSSKPASGGKTRVISGKLVTPETYTNTTTGIISIRNSASSSFTHLIPQDLTETVIKEHVAQFANLLRAVLMQDTAVSGYAPS